MTPTSEKPSATTAPSSHPVPAAYTASLGDPLLDVAARAFDRFGWNGTTVERVAQESGLPLADILRRYPSREHLAAGIMERVLERLPTEFADEIEPHTLLHDRLYSAVAHELRTLDPHKAFVRTLLQEAANPFSATAPLQAPSIFRYLSFITEQIRLARHRGEVSVWVIPAVAASAFWVLHLRIITSWVNDMSIGSEQSHARADRWIGQFVRTLGANPRQRRSP